MMNNFIMHIFKYIKEIQLNRLDRYHILRRIEKVLLSRNLNNYSIKAIKIGRITVVHNTDKS